MRKEVCVAYFYRVLHDIAEGHGLEIQENPAVPFTKKVKDGTFDLTPNDEYKVLLNEVNALSRLWLDQPDAESFSLLSAALEYIGSDDDAIQSIAKLLAEHYSRAVENLDVDDPEDDPEDDPTDDPADNNSSNKWDEAWDELAGLSKPVSSQNQAPARPSKKERALPKVTDSFAVYAGQTALDTPQKIYDYLKTHIYGQEEAVKTAASFLYNHTKGRKRNVLFLGPTGCGKTEIWRVCKQIYPHIHIVNGATLTADGWVGSNKLTDMFIGLDKKTAERSIFVIDEFDKLCEPRNSANAGNYSRMIQNELLKMIEGEELKVKNSNEKNAAKKEFVIDTSRISFAFCGSFEQLTQLKTQKLEKKAMGFGQKLEAANADDLYESEITPDDLTQYAGMRREVAGRISRIVQLRPMTAQDYLAILDDKVISPLFQLERQYGVRLTLDQKTKTYLSVEAERTHMGVRFLRGRLEKMLDNQMFQDCTKKEYTLTA